MFVITPDVDTFIALDIRIIGHIFIFKAVTSKRVLYSLSSPGTLPFSVRSFEHEPYHHLPVMGSSIILRVPLTINNSSLQIC